MIFATVGAQGPFDRLIRTVDDWALSRGRDDVFAQIAETDLEPRRLEWRKFLDPEEFRRRMQDADLIVAHAGMGTIITALELEKPILVMPRRASLRETRNEHQVATARHIGRRHGILVAEDEGELVSWLDRADEIGAGSPPEPERAHELIRVIRAFIASR